MVEQEFASDRVANPIQVTWVLAVREWVRFFRQRNRVIGALGQPIIFWILLGTGMHGAFRGGDQDYMTFYLPGTIALILLFTAIFTTISIIEDRKEGFLQNALVAPTPRWTIAAGKILGGAAIAWVQSLMFLAIALMFGGAVFSTQLIGAIVLLAVAAIALTALGVFFAWPMESTQAFHAIMNLVLMPLWLLSGAFFPVPLLNETSPLGQVIMHWAMRVNPMSYIVAGLRTMMQGEVTGLWVPTLASCWGVSIAFLVITFGFAWWAVIKPAKGDLR